jgi:hypothetical protein
MEAVEGRRDAQTLGLILVMEFVLIVIGLSLLPLLV